MLTRTHALLTGATLCASLVLGATASAQASTPAPQTRPAAKASGTPEVTTRGATHVVEDTPNIDPVDVAVARTAIEEEAQHRDRVARIGRLRDLAQQHGKRDRLAQLDDLAQRESRTYEAQRLHNRSLLSEGSARGVDDFVRRGGTFRAHSQDAAARRAHNAGRGKTGNASAESQRHGATPQRAPQRATRATQPSPQRSPSRAPSHGNGGSRSPR